MFGFGGGGGMRVQKRCRVDSRCMFTLIDLINVDE